MQIHQIQSKTKRKRARPVGRGGTRGKTAGRGTKGQKARAGRKIRPEIRDIIKRIPKMRGRGKNSNLSIQGRVVAINLTDISKAFSNGDIVTRKLLIEKGMIPAQNSGPSSVKVLGGGDMTKKITLKGLIVSASAKDKVVKAGGKIYG
jgi:large subunit ribosomal protein L15